MLDQSRETEPPTARKMEKPEPPEGLARCTRCGQMYEQADPQQCCFHPGQYTDQGVPSKYAAFSWQWSCCKSGDECARGCRTEKGHILCKATAERLETFPTVEVGLRRRVAGSAETKADGGGAAQGRAAARRVALPLRRR